MLSARSRRLILFLVLSLLVIVGCAAGAVFWLARKVPKFNQYIGSYPEALSILPSRKGRQGAGLSCNAR